MSTATIPVAPTMPGVRKAAMFLLGVGDQLGADLLRQLAPDEIRAITTEITSLDAVAPMHMLDVFREFETLTVDSRFFARGGAEFARRMVEQALGAESAQKYLAPASAPKPSAEAAVEFLEGRDPQQLARFLKAENPQTIALVLSNMSAAQAGALMASLPEELRPQVALRMASLDRIAPEVFQRISEAIGSKLRALKSVSRSDGIRSLAALLNQVEAPVAEAILARVDQENQAVGASVRDLMFVFDDIPSIAADGIKALLAKLDRKVLTIALKGGSEQIRTQFTQCMSQRAGEMLAEDMEALGPVRIRDVAAAQKQVVAVVRQLQQEGVISVGRSGEDGYVG
jgi:flagellar motor switch protein FliG